MQANAGRHGRQADAAFQSLDYRHRRMQREQTCARHVSRESVESTANGVCVAVSC